MKAVNGVETGSLQFKTEILVCQLLVQSSPGYNLILKLQSPPDQSEHWTQEELQVRGRHNFVLHHHTPVTLLSTISY